MKQVTRSERTGQVSVREVPPPILRPGWILVETRFSLISASTERSTIESAERTLFQQARTHPDLARKVVGRARSEGLRPTVDAIRAKVASARTDGLAELGYSCSGTVIEVGESVGGVAPGSRVACGGAGWANHAEIVAVPQNLVATVPETVSLEAAAYATVGAIALHAVRQADAKVGGTFRRHRTRPRRSACNADSRRSRVRARRR